jgi:hypothetical protein
LAGSIGSTSTLPARLPGQRVVVDVADLPVPAADAEEMQPHVGVRIDELAGDPRRVAVGLDAELLVELAHQRLRRGLARLDLAAGEFPVAGVGLAFRGGGRAGSGRRAAR